MSIVKEYLNLTLQWKKEYGEKTLVLMQVGSFFEVYALMEENKMVGSNIAEFAALNGMVISPKQSFVDGKQVVMAGFGVPQIEKYVKKLQENGYTTLIYRQDIQGKNTTRSLAEIISPGTFFSLNDDDNENKKISNNVLCLWFHAAVTSKYFANSNLKGQNAKKMTVGIANIDIYTGKTTIFQNDLDFSFHNPSTYDEIERYVSIYNPNECLIIANIADHLVDDIITFIGLDCQKIHRVRLAEETTSKGEKTKMQVCATNAEKQIYQLETFKRFYPQMAQEYAMTSIMSYFIAVQAFCFLLDFVYQHSPNLVRKLQVPVFANHTDKLVLANHSLKQLNIIDDTQHSGKLRSISSFLNNCVTNMGKRQFMSTIHHPITNTTLLNESYFITEHLLLEKENKEEEKTWEMMRAKLAGIKDLEKFIRKLVLHKIVPKEFALLVCDLQVIKEVAEKIQTSDAVLTKYLADHTEKNDIKIHCTTILNELERVFDLEKCSTLNSFDFNVDEDEITLFIKKGVNPAIDALLKAAIESREKMEAIRLYFSNLVKNGESAAKASASSKANASSAQFIKIHETPKSVPVLLGTSKRITTLKAQLKKGGATAAAAITYTSSYTLKNETFELNLAALSYETLGSNKKDLIIQSNEINQLAKDMQHAKDKLRIEMGLFYHSYVADFIKYNEALTAIMQYTTLLDLLQNKCYIAHKYNYCKPVIAPETEKNKSFLAFTGIRHPLIEHLQTNELYVTNDLTIGQNEMDGLLLYGTNAVGKTSFIKSVGIALIMAQAGLYVPCTSFTYKPYTAIFTRILGNDNIFKGLSTFAVEMSELRTILTQTDANSLVLGDELCSGTESDSALSIFTAGLELLHEKGSTFLFATHFHEIVKFEEVQALTRMQMMHMAVQYNSETGVLMYDRRLRMGSGESMYGLEVCKALHLPATFLDRAHAIRIRYHPESRNILSLATSAYNAKKIVGGICEVCKMTSSSEVHHLQPQKKAKKGYITSFHKNHLANLVNICENCHQKIHLVDDKEHKFIKTSRGYELVPL